MKDSVWGGKLFVRVIEFLVMMLMNCVILSSLFNYFMLVVLIRDSFVFKRYLVMFRNIFDCRN